MPTQPRLQISFMLKQSCVSSRMNHLSVYLKKWQVNYPTTLCDSPFIDALTLEAGPQGRQQAGSVSHRNEQTHEGQDAACFKTTQQYY